MITGFNTDIKFEGVTYHVQTEDKGLDSPLILSLVYVGGAIIASKRTPYEDLVASGYDEKVLTERLQRQHKLICAAIRSGRVEELKRMGAHNGSAESQHADEKEQATPEVFKAAASGRKRKKAPAPSVEGDAPVGTASDEESKSEESGSGPGVEADVKADDGLVILTSLMDQVSEVWERSNSYAQAFQPPPIAPPIYEEPPFVKEQDAPAPPWQEEFSELPIDDSDDLYLTLLDDEGDFRAGQLATIKVHVGRGTYGQRPVADASVTVKVLGTTFRPMIQMTETDERGVAVVRATLPRFTSGRAAIIIRASQGDDAIEMRRIIHQ
ncbi:MAG TPA: hypothetical protein VLJ61_15235 [Pyrinomonadaceae bacterium]|nr:hypothetical protein [Pyrinomonadaceae bacterium]